MIHVGFQMCMRWKQLSLVYNNGWLDHNYSQHRMSQRILHLHLTF